MANNVVRSLATLVTQMNENFKHLPPGPERARRINEFARAQLAKAQSRSERLFWEGFLRIGQH